jgi:oligoribonuclease NrnB/cAMP/cGMP phosphodiesterase (DHH superfamily)
MNTEVLKFNICLYHDNCPDGIGAAYPFWRIHENDSNFQIIGAMYNESYPIDKIKNKNVVIVDFSYKRTDLLEMSKVCKSILILDHHKTAKDNLTGIDEECENISYIFDMNRSGAQISWDYCYPTMARPWFIDYIADRDLWKWELPFSKEINKALFIGEWFQFEKLESLYMNTNSVESLKYKFAEQGKIILNCERNFINIAAKSISGKLLSTFPTSEIRE